MPVHESSPTWIFPKKQQQQQQQQQKQTTKTIKQ